MGRALLIPIPGVNHGYSSRFKRGHIPGSDLAAMYGGDSRNIAVRQGETAPSRPCNHCQLSIAASRDGIKGKDASPADCYQAIQGRAETVFTLPAGQRGDTK